MQIMYRNQLAAAVVGITFSLLAFSYDWPHRKKEDVTVTVIAVAGYISNGIGKHSVPSAGNRMVVEYPNGSRQDFAITFAEATLRTPGERITITVTPQWRGVKDNGWHLPTMLLATIGFAVSVVCAGIVLHTVHEEYSEK